MTNKLLAKYLFHEASKQEIAKVEKWLTQSEANHIELDLLRERIDRASQRYRPHTFVASLALKNIRHSIRKPISRLKQIFSYSAAAIFILLVGSGLLYFFTAHPLSMLTVSSNAGQTLVVYLPDSSQVTLAELSELRYPSKFTGKSRAISTKGKLFFKVRRDAAHPFTITTPSIGITVLGTSFQVEADSNQAQVLVKHGKVAILSPDQKQQDTLTSGMSAIWSATNNQLIRSPQFDINLFAWKTKELRFKDTPLPQVIETLNNYYQANIILPQSYGKLHLTATFKNIPLSQALEIINQTLDIHLNNCSK